MATIIEELARLLNRIEGIPMEIRHQADGMLVTLSVGRGRTQTVKVSLHRGLDGRFPVLRLQSRVCIAGNPKIVRAALKYNAESELGGFALDTSTSPPVIDVVYSLPANPLTPEEFLHALQRVACFADMQEQRTGGGDVF